MRIRHTLCIAAILVSGCTLQDAFMACQNEGQKLCVMNNQTGRMEEQSCNGGNVSYRECINGCNIELGTCIPDDMKCTPGEPDVCAGPKSQIRCVELEGQYAEDTDLESVPRYYVKREVPCPNDGVCNSSSHRCDSRSEINDRCDGKDDYCEPSGGKVDTIRHYCSNGTYYSQDCSEDGLVCKSGRCVQSPVCEPITDEPKCKGSRKLEICNEYGQYEERECGEMMECINGACVTMFNAGDPCNSATFVEYCSEDGLYQCINEVVSVTNCADTDGQICEDPDFKNYGAGCYSECETAGMITGRLSCISNDQKLNYQACIATSSGRNVLLPETVTNTCFGNSYTSCSENRVSMEYCSGGCHISASMGYNVQCLSVTPNVNCNAGEVFGCVDANTQMICDPSSLLPQAVPCSTAERCSQGKCVPAESPAIAGEFCDPEATVSHCMDDTVLLRCNPETRLYEYVNCSEYIINYQTYGEKPATGTCHEIKDDTGNTTTGTCGVACGGTTCYTDEIYHNSCLDGKFIHLTNVLDIHKKSINRITEMVSRCDGKRMYYCVGNEMKIDSCPVSCRPETLLTAKCE